MLPQAGGLDWISVMKPLISTRRDFLKQATGLGLSVAALGSMVPASAIGKSGERGRNRSVVADGRLWLLNITLSHPRLVPPFVQVALFHKDPVMGFTTRLQRIGQLYREHLQATVGARRAQRRSAQMTALWDHVFRDVRGDQVHLLASFPLSICSNGPEGKHWIVTKCADAEAKVVCWCLPVELRHGQSIEVSLTPENTFDVSAVYESEMG